MICYYVLLQSVISCNKMWLCDTWYYTVDIHEYCCILHLQRVGWHLWEEVCVPAAQWPHKGWNSCQLRVGTARGLSELLLTTNTTSNKMADGFISSLFWKALFSLWDKNVLKSLFRSTNEYFLPSGGNTPRKSASINNYHELTHTLCSSGVGIWRRSADSFPTWFPVVWFDSPCETTEFSLAVSKCGTYTWDIKWEQYLFNSLSNFRVLKPPTKIFIRVKASMEYKIKMFTNKHVCCVAWWL